MCVCVALIWAAAAVAQDRSGSDTRFFPNRFTSNDDRDRDPQLPAPLMCVRDPVPPYERSEKILAIVVFPGPATNHSVRFEVWPYLPERLLYLVLDGFDAFDGATMGFDAGEVVTAPYLSDTHVDHPAVGEHGAGPLMVAFPGEFATGCAAIRVEADRWGDEATRATVGDLPGTRVDVLFEKGVRGVGEVQICREDGRLPWCPFMDFRCTPGDAIALIVRRGK